MFKKLKMKLIMINVILLTIVLIMIFLGIYFFMKQALKYQSEGVMNVIAKDERIIPITEGPNFSANSFFIKTDKSGNIMELSQGLTLKKEDVEKLKKIVLEKPEYRGYSSINDFELRFLKVDKDYGNIIVFLNTGYEKEFFNWLMIASIAIGIVSLALVFLISFYIAGKAIIPIKNSWEKQNAFIADASHEFRTPLAVINSNLEVVVDNDEETVKSQGKWLNNIQGELTRMTKLVDDLLFLTRADMDEEEMQMAHFDLSNLTSQIAERFKPLTDKKNINLSLEIKQDIIVWGNEGRVKQLINILLDNGIKNTTEKGTIKLELLSDEYSSEIIVSDDGRGIQKEHLEKIFERFYRADKSRSKAHGGSGLGLSIAKCIVNEHNWQIQVSSVPGEGATFRVVLPNYKVQ